MPSFFPLLSFHLNSVTMFIVESQHQIIMTLRLSVFLHLRFSVHPFYNNRFGQRSTVLNSQLLPQ